MLSTLMALQSGLPPLDFRVMISKDKEAYIQAIQVGVGGNYAPMEKVFVSVISKTLRVRGRK